MSDLNALVKQIRGDVSDKFLGLLLDVMDWGFQKHLLVDIIAPGMKDFRRNLDGFEGRYLFLSKDNEICEAALFKNNDMKVLHDVIPDDHKHDDHKLEDWDLIVTFKDSKTFMDFLFSGDQDILNVALENGVELDGNLNYMMKFGFLAKDLTYKCTRGWIKNLLRKIGLL